MKVKNIIILFFVLNFIPINLKSAEWFILPGFYYLPDTGVTGFILSACEYKISRFMLDLEYADKNEQLYKFNYVLDAHKWKMESNIYWEKNFIDIFCFNNSVPHQSGSYIRKRSSFSTYIGKKLSKKIIGLYFVIENNKGNNADNIGKEEINGHLLKSGSYFEINKVDNLYNTMEGIKIKVSAGVLKSENYHSFFPEAGIDLRFYFPLIKNRLSNCFQIKSSFIIKSTLPLYSSYCIGGSKSLRGYSREVVCGTKMFLAREETRIILFKNIPLPLFSNTLFDIQFVIFADTGTCWTEKSGPKNYLTSGGAGLHLVFPPDVVIRFDLASPFNYSSFNFYMDCEQSF